MIEPKLNIEKAKQQIAKQKEDSSIVLNNFKKSEPEKTIKTKRDLKNA